MDGEGGGGNGLTSTVYCGSEILSSCVVKVLVGWFVVGLSFVGIVVIWFGEEGE